MFITLVSAWLAAGMVAALLAWPVALFKRRLIPFWTFWSFWLPPMLLVLLIAPRSPTRAQPRPGWDDIDALGGDG